MDKFDEFCKGKNFSSNQKLAFRWFIEDRYPEGIPVDINLESEYQSYLREGTSKL